MAARVLPSVRLVFPCDNAVLRTDGKWVLTNPRAVINLPGGATFPVTVKEMWVYVHLAEGVGDFDLSLELRYVEVDDTRTVIGRGKPVPLAFPAGRQLYVFDTAIHLTKVPLYKQGLFELAVVVADGEPSQWVPLAGPTAMFRVLSGRS